MMHEAPIAYDSLRSFALHAKPNDFRTGFWEMFSYTIVDRRFKYAKKEQIF